MKLSKHCRFPVYNYDMIESGKYNPAGSIIWMMGEAVPLGYLLCDGSAVGRNNYPDLFAAIGTTYGEGDGSTTFNLPDLMDKFVEGSSTAGVEHEAGLPNIEGKYTAPYHYSPYFEGTSEGALNNPATSSINKTYGGSSGSSSHTTLVFDASKSNSIYGNSNTVQPESLTAMPCIKAYNDISISNSKSGGRGIAYEPDTEVFTGDYWIDGKPIYAYVKTKNLPAFVLNNAIKFASVSDFSMDTLIGSELLVTRADGVKILGSTDIVVTISIQNNGKDIAIYTTYNQYVGRTPHWILLKYTKTTD